MMSALLARGDFWMPVQGAEGAWVVDWLFYFIFWVSLVFFIIIAGGMFWFMWRYRRRHEEHGPESNISHNTALELTWTIIPTILLIPMFWWGFTGFMDSRVAPNSAYDINVIAQKWSWRFVYPNNYDDNNLHVPAEVPIRLVMRSEDVIHSCYIPDFRVKRDVVPGRYSSLWFTAKGAPGRTTEHHLFCAEYCGTSHSDMKAKVIVHPSREDFDAWLANADPLKQLAPEQYEAYVKDPGGFIEELRKTDPDLAGRLVTPVENGRRLYEKKGCAQCHTITKDAPSRNGPTWWNVYGHKVLFRDGSSIESADENYLRESIVNPGARIVAGYDNIMGPQRVNDREIDALIAFIKTLRDDYQKP